MDSTDPSPEIHSPWPDLSFLTYGRVGSIDSAESWPPSPHPAPGPLHTPPLPPEARAGSSCLLGLELAGAPWNSVLGLCLRILTPPLVILSCDCRHCRDASNIHVIPLAWASVLTSSQAPNDVWDSPTGCQSHLLCGSARPLMNSRWSPSLPVLAGSSPVFQAGGLACTSQRLPPFTLNTS